MSCAVLHDYCKNCQKTRVADKEGPVDKKTLKPIYKAGDFIINCKGIPGDNKFIPSYDKIVKKLNPQEVELAQGIYDPITWAKNNIKWSPRKSKEGDPYQEVTLRCSSKRKVLRWGRRLGKSDVLAIRALHFLYNNSPKSQRWDEERKEWVDGFGTVLILTPYLSQVKNLFGRIQQLIDRNPELQKEIKRSISTPYHLIELWNGARIVGFSAGAEGAASVRGQKADLIILDEMDYLDESSIENIMALLMEHGDVELIAASTPTGRRENFYRFCMERMDFKEFHYSSQHNPAWNTSMEMELRDLYKTESGWLHEIEAEFGEAATSVFQYSYVYAARSDYRYEEQNPEPDWTYAIGVDWNDVNNGTKIVVTGFDPLHNIFKVVAKETVQKLGWTQSLAIQKIIELNRAWKPAYCYVDAGYGAMQVEVIKKFGMDAKYTKHEHSRVDSNLENVVGINFSSRVEVKDPLTGEVDKKPMKPYLVQNAVRRFEQGMVRFSAYDELLYRQLIGYQIAKVNSSGMEIYEAGNDGDHDLDGLMLSLLAFQMETSEFIKPNYNGQMGFSGKFGQQTNQADIISTPGNSVLTGQLDRPRDIGGKAPEQRSYNESKPALTGGQPQAKGKIYSVSAFNNDDPTRRSQVKRNEGFLKRGGSRTGRKSF